ncbi:hypothetical protein XELAEV_18020295mg [Xenopus laevis]|uniref:Uncharacterized protein n=1 Tax=Xenopus laevis TaxID=8355 RepID=A0A974HQW3_XENLA|nr:hypothetical protein XELAEV_18020295mg [Xenopus laevis]
MSQTGIFSLSMRSSKMQYYQTSDSWYCMLGDRVIVAAKPLIRGPGHGTSLICACILTSNPLRLQALQDRDLLPTVSLTT